MISANPDDDFESAAQTSRRVAIAEAFECCRQIVRSYGPKDLPEHVRDNLCKAMVHYERTAK